MPSELEVAPGPLLRPGELWAFADLCKALKVSGSTAQMWEQNGLSISRPRTNAKFVWSDDVIDFMRSHPTSDTLQPLVSNYKREATQ